MYLGVVGGVFCITKCYVYAFIRFDVKLCTYI